MNRLMLLSIALVSVVLKDPCRADEQIRNYSVWADTDGNRLTAGHRRR